jgi:CDP-diacylglycerol--glycerol-3-phosphate 3-phosphatidyltransferase
MVKEWARRALAPVARVLAGLGITPNHITVAGLLLMAAAGVFLAYGRFLAAAFTMLAGGLCDMLDGAVARSSGHSSPFGAFFDSTADRFAELFLFAGLLVYFTDHDPSLLYLLLTFFALGGSFMVSYTRARSEGLGIACRVGLMERPERVVLLLLAALIGPVGMKVALWILVPLTMWTALQRIQHVMKATRTP